MKSGERVGLKINGMKQGAEMNNGYQRRIEERWIVDMNGRKGKQQRDGFRIMKRRDKYYRD